MNILLVATLFTVSVLCLAFYIYDQWSMGHNLVLGDLVMMFLMALLPVLNLFIVLYLIAANHCGNVILKGRGR